MVAAGRLGRKAGPRLLRLRRAGHTGPTTRRAEPRAAEAAGPGPGDRSRAEGFRALSLGAKPRRAGPGGSRGGLRGAADPGRGAAGGDRRGDGDRAPTRRRGGAPLRRARQARRARRRPTLRGWSSAESSARSSTRRTSRSRRESRRPRTSTPRCASASIGPAGRSNGPRRSGPSGWSGAWTHYTPSWARSDTGWRRTAPSPRAACS